MNDATLNLQTCKIPPQQDWPKGCEVRQKFGQRILWYPTSIGGHHMTNEQLEPYRQIGDVDVDEILKLLDQDGRKLKPADDLLALAEQAVQSPPTTSIEKKLVQFWTTYHTLPPWVDIQQLERGQQVYLAYTAAASLSLYYRSLVAGFSIPKIAKVIQSTKYLTPPSRPDQVFQRLLDTGELIATCMGGAKGGVYALLPGGDAWKTALHVRILHAKVRYNLLNNNNNNNDNDQKWDTAQYGVPINQEDMAGTLLAFSVNVLAGIEFVAGKPVSEQERKDYMALWRYIGWLLGVPIKDETTTISDMTINGNQATKNNDNNNNNGNDNSNNNNNKASIIRQPSLSTLSPALTSSFSSLSIPPPSVLLQDDEDDDNDEKDSDENHNQQKQSPLPSLPPLDPCAPGVKYVGKHAIYRSDALFMSIAFHLIDPDDSSRAVAHHLLQVSNRRDLDHYKNDWYYFRCLQCRKFIGSPLADALDLPFHSNVWKRWKFAILSICYFVLIRLYTLIPMLFPSIRQFLINYHRKTLQNFHSDWLKTHKTKMAIALRTKTRPSILWTGQEGENENEKSNSKTKKNQQEEIEILTSTKNDGNGAANFAPPTICPFAMVAPPS